MQKCAAVPHRQVALQQGGPRGRGQRTPWTQSERLRGSSRESVRSRVRSGGCESDCEVDLAESWVSPSFISSGLTHSQPRDRGAQGRGRPRDGRQRRSPLLRSPGTPLSSSPAALTAPLGPGQGLEPGTPGAASVCLFACGVGMWVVVGCDLLPFFTWALMATFLQLGKGLGGVIS